MAADQKETKAKPERTQKTMGISLGKVKEIGLRDRIDPKTLPKQAEKKQA